jgi:beta-glucosidase
VHLPITFEKRQEDNPSFSNYYPESGTKRVVYKEGIFVGYRGYEHHHTKPLFPFGFGLSNTTCSFANLAITEQNTAAGDLNYFVSFDIKNSGKRPGAEVAQVYVADTGSSVSRPPKELKEFVKVGLKPGETQHVTVPLGTRSFALLRREQRSLASGSRYVQSFGRQIVRGDRTLWGNQISKNCYRKAITLISESSTARKRFTT